MNNLKRLSSVLFTEHFGIVTRQVQSNASLLENCREVENRNPRNLECMTIAHKPTGYNLDKSNNQWWNKLSISVEGKHIKAEIFHFQNGSIITVSTKEWALKKQLVKNRNISSFSNMGKLLAQRCLESGITSVYCDINAGNSRRFASFLEEMQKSGIELEEPKQYKHARPQDTFRMIKPWTIEKL